MATLTYPSTIVGGTTEDVGQLNSNLTAIQQVVNSLDDANISATAGIQASKIASGATGLAQGSFRAFRTAALSLPTASVVIFDTDSGTDAWDVSSWFDTTTGRFTPQVPGYYRFSWLLTSNLPLAVDIQWFADLRKNAAVASHGQPYFQRGSAVSAASGGTDSLLANGTTDFFDVVINHGVGASTAFFVGSPYTHFSAELIGRS